ncbi:MAG: hypothetical protein WBQ37_05100 [Candidatus Competibacter sp.]
MPRKSTLDPQMKALLDNLNLDDSDNELLAEPTEDAADRLRTLHQRLTNGRENALRPGMLAVWKPGLKNRRFPAYGQPAMVVEVIDPPLIDHEDEAGSPYYREPLGLLLGILHQDGDFFVYHFDPRRFQPHEDPGTPIR